jgi:hypothetical protein
MSKKSRRPSQKRHALALVAQLQAQLQAQGLLQPGTVAIADVAHDAWCAFYKGRECSCTPDITVEALPPGPGEARNGKEGAP